MTKSLQLLTLEALGPHRLRRRPPSSSSPSSSLTLSPRDAAQALTGIAALGPAALGRGDREGGLSPRVIAAAATALTATVRSAGGAGGGGGTDGWGAQEAVGLAEGAAALAAALGLADAGGEGAVGAAWLALEGLGQALVARAGGGAACRGPPGGKPQRKVAATTAAASPEQPFGGVARLWRPRDRRRVAAALAALLPPAPLALASLPRTPALAPGLAAAAPAVVAAALTAPPERWLLRARVRAAPSPAAIQALLLDAHALPSSPPPDGVALARGVQRLGRLCAGRRREQATARGWLVPHLAVGPVAAAVGSMDGRALASFLDGLSMLLGTADAAPLVLRAAEHWPLAAGVDAAMARGLLPTTPVEAGGGELPPWLLAPDAARLFPALVRLGYGIGDASSPQGQHRRSLLALAHRRAAAGAAALPLPVVGRLLHATATAAAASSSSPSSLSLSLSAPASEALLRQGADLMLLSSSRAGGRGACPKDAGNLVFAAAALAEASGSGPSAAPALAEPLAALARGVLAWEAARPLPDAGMTALDLAKLLGGLSRLLREDEAAMVAAAPRWLARARALLPDARLRTLAAVAAALAAVPRRQDREHGEALRAFVADARRRLPALVAGRQEWERESEAEVHAALVALEEAAAAAEGGCSTR